MNTITLDLANKLDGLGVGTVGTDIIIGPDRSVDQTSIFITQTGGDANPKWLRDDTTIQFRIKTLRNQYAQGESKGQEIKDALLGLAPFTVDGVTYARFVILSDLQYVGQDENRQQIFSINFIVTRDYDSGGNRQQI